MYLGLDCSTQSLTAVIINAETGAIAYQTSINFEADLPQYQTRHGFVRGTEPDEFFSNPLMWIEALDLLFERMQQEGAPLSSVKAISGAAQQHGTVYLNHNFKRALAQLSPNIPLTEQFTDVFSRPVAPIWLDASTHIACGEIAHAIGGHRKAAFRTGSSVTPRFSAAQIRKHAQQFPERWAETETVHLVSSFMASILAGKSVAIDYGDGAGMNLMHIKDRCWDQKMADITADHTIERLPALAPTTDICGTISPYFSEKYGINPAAKCAHWTGDNPASLVGMGVVHAGNWVISLGTSYTLFAAVDSPFPDPQGYGHIFGNPIGGYMSLSCFKNGALSCVTLKNKLDISWAEFEKDLLTPRSEQSDVTLPFYETEITPLASSVDQPTTTPSSHVDGQFLNMRLHCQWHGETPETIVVTGGISVSTGICQALANVFQRPVQRLQTSSSASLGAAIIAAYADAQNIDSLIDHFCHPIEGTTIEPDPAMEKIYQVLGNKFNDKLYKHLME
ncbi:xylulokinase [Rubritalea spongiae]|uniref:Xylulokinase n=1 Tax=Rubritalea spongiae TaxID=430797 RepID=A0ABW5E9P0_9BACT